VRRVFEREQAFLEHYFGPSLSVSRIAIGSSLGRRSWSPYGARISLVRGLFEHGDPRAEVRLDDPHAASVFAHEALHVWQRERGRRVTWEGARLQTGYVLRLFDPYAYDCTVRDPGELLSLFMLGNIEQQGRMFQDYVYADRCGHDCVRFRAIARWVQSGASQVTHLRLV
jgi:hypothetical protein